MKVPPPPPSPLPAPALRQAGAAPDRPDGRGPPFAFAQALLPDAPPPPPRTTSDPPADAPDAPAQDDVPDDDPSPRPRESADAKPPQQKADKTAEESSPTPSEPAAAIDKTDAADAATAKAAPTSDIAKSNKPAKDAAHKPHRAAAPSDKPTKPTVAPTTMGADAAPPQTAPATPPASATAAPATPPIALADEGPDVPEDGLLGNTTPTAKRSARLGPSAPGNAAATTPGGDAAEHVDASAVHPLAPDRPDPPAAKPAHPGASGKPFANLIPAEAHAHPATTPASAAMANVTTGATPDAARPAHDGDAPRAAAGDGSAFSSALGVDPTAQHTRPATGPQAAYATRPITVPPAVQQIALHITRAAEDGIDRFTVQLKPADLGRISAQITFHDHHNVQVVISAQRADTLAALRNDAGALARALQDAGLRADAGSLSFQFQGQNQGAPSGGHAPSTAPVNLAVPAPVGVDAIAPASLATALLRPGGVDLRV